MELSAEMDVQHAKGLIGAKITVQLMYVLISRRPSTTGDDIFTGLCNIGLCRFISTLPVSKSRIIDQGQVHPYIGSAPVPPQPPHASVRPVHLFAVALVMLLSR